MNPLSILSGGPGGLPPLSGGDATSRGGRIGGYAGQGGADYAAPFNLATDGATASGSANAGTPSRASGQPVPWLALAALGVAAVAVMGGRK